MALTKAEMAEALFNQLGLNKREARELVDMFFEEVRAALAMGEQVSSPASATSICVTRISAPAEIPKRGGDPDQRTARRDVPSGPRSSKRGSRPMLEASNNDELPPIPGKRYFTIGEVSDLCGVKPHVLRYWEQEFPQLKPVKRRGNRRYYQRQDVIVIRQIRSLLYEQGFTIGGARNRLTGDEAREDLSMSVQIVRQLRTELEEILRILRR